MAGQNDGYASFFGETPLTILRNCSGDAVIRKLDGHHEPYPTRTSQANGK